MRITKQPQIVEISCDYCKRAIEDRAAIDFKEVYWFEEVREKDFCGAGCLIKWLGERPREGRWKFPDEGSLYRISIPGIHLQELMDKLKEGKLNGKG